jgi:hypothetical protein
MTPTEYQQLLDEQMRARAAMNGYPGSAAYGHALAAQQSAMMQQSAMLNTAPFGNQSTRRVVVGRTVLHERDVQELHNLIDFMKFATEADEKMKEMWTAFVVARKLEG